jgi:alkylhydroperoxidase family enzyme
VTAVLDDFRSAPISDAEKALFAFVEKVNRESRSVEQQDVDELHRAGWDDEAIYDAVNVCGLFNFYNRWIDATGVREMPAELHRLSGQRLAERGYLVAKAGEAH